MESSTASTWTRTFLQSATESLRHVPNTCGATRISNPPSLPTVAPTRVPTVHSLPQLQALREEVERAHAQTDRAAREAEVQYTPPPK